MGRDGVDEADAGPMRHGRSDFDFGIAGSGIESGIQGARDPQEFLGERMVRGEPFFAHGSDTTG